MKRSIICLLFLLWCFLLPAQKVIIEESPDKVLEPPLFGVKGRHYVYLFYELGVPLGNSESDTLEIHNRSSLLWNFGVQYKMKLAKKFALVATANYNFHSYSLRQNANTFPDTLSHKREKINLNQVGGSVGLRHIYSQRKKYFGKYFELGGTLAWNFATAHYTRDDLHIEGSDAKESVVRVRHRNPGWMFPYSAEVYVATAVEKIQFRIYYRLTDIFKEYAGKRPGELPAIRIAINFAVAGNK